MQRVLLGGQPAVEIVSSNSSHVVVRAGAGTPGVGDVVLESASGSRVTEVNGWVYLVASTISSVSPTSGQIGTVVDIHGSNLLGVEVRLCDCCKQSSCRV